MVEFEEIEIVQPADGESAWRYMDLTPYLSMLQTSSIYFSPLSAFDDPFEGASPHNLSLSSVLAAHLAGGKMDKTIWDASELASRRVRAVTRDATCVTCWYLSEHESDAMWRLYSRSNASIALKTSCGKLRAQMPNSAQFGKLRYIDFPTFPRPSGSFSYDPAFFKRKAFEHEKEMRIKLDATETIEALMRDPLYTEGSALGKTVAVDLPTLVDCVVVNPTAPKWMVDCIRDVTQRYGFEFDIRHSTMMEQPSF